MKIHMAAAAGIFMLFAAFGTQAGAAAAKPDAGAAMHADIDKRTAAVEPQVVAWRRDIHEHPELGNRETRTAKLVADHLTKLGLEVKTGVGVTGVVGVLKGGKPGPVVALRADMDALPVTERVDLPFASKVKTTYNGAEVGVMHACGHDNHVAILMGTAEVLAGMKATLPGTVKFIFQPAEEGPPDGEEGGAALMIKEGALENPVPDAIFGLHVFPLPVGEVRYRPNGFLASADSFKILVKGRQTHGAAPWKGVDPIVVASQIVLGLQTIASRQLDVTLTPSIVTVGIIKGGVRNNIIPDDVYLEGTLRTFDAAVRTDIHERLKRTAKSIAESAGATADVTVTLGYPVTVNDPALTEKMVPTIARVTGPDHSAVGQAITGAEDFSYFAEKVPGLFVALGVAPPGDPDKAASNHSPLFYADEKALPVGVRLLSNLTVDYMLNPLPKKAAKK